MQKSDKTLILVIIAALGSLLLSACGASQAEPTPTISIEAIQTSAVATFAAGITQTAISMPTNTPLPTETPVPTNTPVPTSTVSTLVPTATCYSLAYIKDVTIPDNTVMTPGQIFTKTWQVKNNGTCPWEAGFKFAFTGGDAMGSTTLTLSKVVNPGEVIDLSVPMTAPNKTGTVKGNWRMSTSSGTYFGDEVYVVISLGGSTATATATTPPPP